MAMPSDFAANILQNQSNLPTDLMARLILFYQKSIETPEDDTVVTNLLYSPLIDLHDTTFDIVGGDIEQVEFDNHIGSSGYSKIQELPFHSDPLIYDFTNASGISHHQPDQNVGTRFGGAAITNGSSNMMIEDHPSLDFTDEFTMVCWAYLKIGTGQQGFIFDKSGPNQISLDRLSNDRLEFIIELDTIKFLFSPVAPSSDGWHHIVVTSKSGEQKLYLDNVLVDSDSATGTFTSTADFHIFSTQGGSTPLQSGEGLAWLSIFAKFVDSAWVDKDFNGVRDLRGIDELICFPFMNNLKPEPPMTSGIFKSSP